MAGNIDEIITSLTNQVAAYDSMEVVASVGALQLITDNASRAIRLEALAHAAMSVPSGAEKPAPSPSRLRQLCGSPELTALACLEDPCDNSFTEDFTFSGGSYTVFPGILEEPTYVLRQLGKAVFLGRQPFPNRDFVRQASQLFRAVLCISDALAKKAGLRRGLVPSSIPGGDIVVPPSSELERLKSCVTFTARETSRLLGEVGVHASALDDLASEIGSLSPESYSPDDHPLAFAPIAEHEDVLIIACPGLLLAALRHRLITLAAEHGVTQELAERFHLAVWQSVIDSLGYLGMKILTDRKNPVDSVPLHEGIFEFDGDKALYLQLITDDFSGYHPTRPFARWNLDNLDDVIRAPLREAEAGMLGGEQPPNEMFTVVLLQGVGRPYVGTLGSEVFHRWMRHLVMTAADLETTALLEGGDPLVIWKYAGSYERIRESTMVSTTGALDEFQLYRARDHSYYISDEKPPNGLMIAPGGSGELRREVSANFDRHGVTSYKSGFITEVAALGADATGPIYFPFSDLGRRATLLLETEELPIWVVGPDPTEDPVAQSQHFNYALLVDAICYWLWQFESRLSETFRRLAKHMRYLVIEVMISEGVPDKSLDSMASGEKKEPTIVCHPEVESCRLRLNLDLRALALFATQDNEGERQLMRHVVEGLDRLLEGLEGSGSLSEEVIRQILDRYAPLGQKKKILVLDPASNPDLDPTELPRLRGIESADVHDLLDELGSYFKDARSLPLGPVREPSAVLNEAVGLLYARLEHFVSTLCPDGLLEWFVGQAEASVRTHRELILTMPTRLACFGNHARLVEDLAKQLPEVETTWLSNRFAIEYIVARPPAGLRPISLSVHDTLLAIASQIVHWASVSDLIQYGVADIQVAMLPSGRLASSQESYLEPRARYLSSYVAGEISRGSAEFGRFWHETGRDEPEASEVDELDSAFLSEFGLLLRELVELGQAILAIGYEQSGPAKRMRLDTLLERLVAEMDWPAERVTDAVNLLSLEPRQDFMQPPLSFRRNDVYPWRFNRALSYVRRPLLKRHSGQHTEVLWGNRHLYTSVAHLIDLCFSGRLKAASPQMKTIMSRLSKDRGNRFNSKVASLFETQEGLVIRQRVKKVGQLRMEGPEGPLGDVDVLVACPARRRILAVETKDLAVARNPAELSRELPALFADKDGERCVVSRHGRRVEWMRTHLDAVLGHLEIEKRGRWHVDGLLVVDEEILSPYFCQSTIPVVPIAQLVEYIKKWAR